MKILSDERGATVVEFALTALPVFLFIFGIMQTAYIVWADNLLHLAVDTAARCGAVQSTTPPCQGLNMMGTADTVFNPLGGAMFGNNLGCSAAGGAGVTGTYTINIVAVTLTLTAQSCFAAVSS
jgi:Flp pilus assembly protein TadG